MTTFRHQAMAQDQEDCMQLLRSTSGTSTSSSTSTDIGLPPLPRQRSATPNWSALLAHQQELLQQQQDQQQQQQQQGLFTAMSAPLPEGCAPALLGCGPLSQDPLYLSLSSSSALDALMVEACRQQHQQQHQALQTYGSCDYSCVSADTDAMSCEDATYNTNSNTWEAAAASSAIAAALASSRRRSQQQQAAAMLQGSTSYSSNLSTASHHGAQQLGSRRCHSTASAGSPTRHQAELLMSAAGPAGAPTPPQLQVRAKAALKLRAIGQQMEALRLAEHSLQHELEGARADSPRSTGAASAMAAAAAVASAPLVRTKTAAHVPQQQREALRQQQRTMSCMAAVAATAGARVPHRVGGLSPPAGTTSRRHTHTSSAGSGSTSTSAALLAAHVDPALVDEYLQAHRLQQQQHQACIAAVTAAAPGSGSPRSGGVAHFGGPLTPAAAAKLRQLLALQQQQIVVQQELLSLLA